MQTVQLARLLEEAGQQVSVVQTNYPYRPAWAARLKGIRAVFRLVPSLWQIWRLCGRVQVVHLMANSGWSWQLFAAPGLWIGWVRGAPVIVNYRGGEAETYLRRSARWIRPSMARATSLVVPSGFLEEVFSRFGMQPTVIPNIVDLDLFRPAEAASVRDNFTLVITRNLEPIYGLDVAIHALAIARESTPDVQLVIAVSGPQQAGLEALVRSLGLEEAVNFCGRLDRQQIVSLYQSADAALNPTRVDNMPNSVLEALACGLPVISTDVGGVPYIVRDGQTALLVRPDDAAAMAQAPC